MKDGTFPYPDKYISGPSLGTPTQVFKWQTSKLLSTM